MKPATLLHPMGSMGEQVDDLCCPPIEPVKTLEQLHAEFPTLTRVQGNYMPWAKAQGDAS